MDKHTLGPWIVRHDFKCANGDLTIGVQSTKTGAAIAWPCGKDDAEELANARLIAAAPELLDALEGVTRILEAFSYTNKFAPSQTERLEKAKAALKKARGD